ncbi:hypothetical protein C1752_03688 [Acaryochloris thomasi RCC1774]|uniref:Uncharacterized protein n=1 Tax=Acaryochloris thomasi RCC1774 TaxID=1764569 RepID=A0A2W1JNQ2_9CYAN|nr:hypothetical protein [Acaryochloris thomasi]PZD72502.1 hypothetical protein C1752_03688 [Acaryochloris thomasi RCC1774]
MSDSPTRSPLATLLTQLTATNQELSQSLARLAQTTERLSQNLDWVDGRITILDEDQHRLAEPEATLTQAIQEAGPDLMATLMMQRSQLQLQSRSLSHNFQQDWLQHGSRKGQPKPQSD